MTGAELMAFAADVRAKAIADERRRCAWIADQYATGAEGSETACRIADEIRNVEKTDAERRAVDGEVV